MKKEEQLELIDLHAESRIVRYLWDCPVCFAEQEITVEQFADEFNNYPYGGCVTCSKCGNRFEIEDVHY